MARLLLLGGSNSQINAVKKAKQKGHTVIVTDYFADAPGKEFSDFSEMVSTFDSEGCLEVARKYKVDGILTVGTDQPVLTCAKVACELGLPTFIDIVTAKAVTNKRVMKSKFTDNGIPTPQYRLLKNSFADHELDGIRFPVVIKPLDSQGQRGVYKLDAVGDIRNFFQDVLNYSREKEILVEEYYDSDEITLSGWVHDGTVYILTITDRISMKNYPHIGICVAHDFPSRYLHEYYKEIKDLTEQIVEVFGIKNGPIYFQMLIGGAGIMVNEIACRIGGAYEDELIPALTGINILDMLIKEAAGEIIDYSALEKFDFLNIKEKASVEMFFIKEGIIDSMSDMEKIKEQPGVISGKLNFKLGSYVKKIENATQRAGYMIITGKNRDELRENIRNAYKNLKICNSARENMIMSFRGICL
ncbi:MAG: ATP-grasp domain-containing protein [Eubacteriales bacterium]